MNKIYDKNNVFNKIICGEIPCKPIIDTKYSLAFFDIAPKAPIHVLILPKGNYIDMLDFVKNATEIEQQDFWEVVQKISNELGVAKTSFRLVANTGAPLQEVFHFHLHLMAEKPNEKCEDK